MRILNTHTRPIPDPKPLNETEADRLSDLQRRAHLRHKNKDGDLPLRLEERKELAALSQRWNDRNQPTWGGDVTLNFTPHGEQGSVIEVRDDIARELVKQHPGRLRLLAEDEPNPKGVKTVKGPRPKSMMEQTYGTNDLLSLPTDGGLTRALSAEYGRLKDGDDPSPMAVSLPSPAHPGD